jgi:hypothetical protein
MSQPISIKLDYNQDTMIAKNAKMFRNTAAIEIGELKDALSYAEFLLAKNMQEKEELMKQNNDH